MLITVKGQVFALGMQWADFGSTKAAKAALSKTRDAKSFVILESTGGVDVSDEVKTKILGYCADKFVKNTIPAGLAVGVVYPTCVVAQSFETPEGTKWWCAQIIGGVPVVGVDLWVDEAEATARVREAVQRGVGEVIGDIPGKRRTLHDALEEFVQQMSGKHLDKAMLGTITLKAKPSVLRLAIILAVVICLIGVAVFGWMYVQKQRRLASDRSLSLSQLAQAAGSSEKMAADRARLIAKFHSDVEAKRAELVSLANSGMVIWDVWSQARRAQPFTVNGFRLESFECDRKKCVGEWSTKGPRVDWQGQRAIPGWIDGPLTGSPRNEVILDVPPSASGADPTVPNANFEELQQLTRFVVPGAAFGPAQPVQVKPPGDNLGLSVETVGSKGTYSSALTLVATNDAVRVFSGKGVFLSKVRFVQLTGATPSVQLDGGYVVGVHGSK